MFWVCFERELVLTYRLRNYTSSSGIENVILIFKCYNNAYISAWSICEWTCNPGEAKRTGKSGVVHGEAGEQTDRHAWAVWGKEGEESSPAGESACIQEAWVVFESDYHWWYYHQFWGLHGYECPSHTLLEWNGLLFGRYVPVFRKNLLPSSWSTLKMEAAILFSVLVAESQNISQHRLKTLILYRVF